MKKLTIFCCALMFGCLLSSLPAKGALAISASQWKAGRIIDDTVFTNQDDMSVAQIQAFLNSKVPVCDSSGVKTTSGGITRAQYGANNGNPTPFTCLKDYYEVPKTQPGPGIPANNYGGQPIPAGAKSAAQMIWEAAQEYKISPRVILVNIQKESGMITDEWPFKKEFFYVMGTHCPDSTGCDENYASFSLQVREGTKVFRDYLNNMTQSWWPYRKPFQNNVIAYSPNGACGGSSVYIETKATAALYTYTPYQPNQASLDAGYGGGDACSSHGNRNFWLFFSDWFGTTYDTSFQLVISDDGNPTQYVIYNNLKQAIGSPEMKAAWGLDHTPLNTVSAGYLAGLVNGPALDVLFRVNGGTTVYLADNGNKYAIGSANMMQAWGLEGKTISNVTTGLGFTPTDNGPLSYALRKVNDMAVYMVDGLSGTNPVLRRYQNPDVLTAIEGGSPAIIDVSATLFDSLDNAVGSDLTTTKAAYQGSEYQLIAGQRMLQSASVAPLYPGVAASISSHTFNRLAQTAPASSLVRSVSSLKIYLLDGGGKRQIGNSDLLAAWTPLGHHVNVVNDGFINLIPSATSIDSFIATNSGSSYLISGGHKIPIPTSLTSAYTNNQHGTQAIGATLAGLLPNFDVELKGIIKGVDSPAMYLLDNSGKRRHLQTPAEATAWGVPSTGFSTLPDAIVNSFATTAEAQLFVTDGSTQYVMLGGKKTTLGSDIKSKWGLTNKTPQTYSDNTLSRFDTGSALDDKGKDANGHFLIRDSKAFYTTDSNIAKIWGIDTATTDYSALVNRLIPVDMLTRFVKSSTDGIVYAVDGGSWYSLSAAHQTNLGAQGSLTTLNPSNAPSTPAIWTSTVMKTQAGSWFAIDGGGKRTFPHPVIQNHWTANGSLSVAVVSDAFVNLLPTKGIIERAVKGDGPAVYSAENATKRWIQSPNTYQQSFAPYAEVSSSLINAMQNGADIP